MNGFVKKCRREWKRLRVPEAVANEMAADLEADLKEAEAEGASPEDVLGTAVFDPRSFAASWAAERGVIPPPPTSKSSLNGRTPYVVAGVAFALIAALGAGMVIASHAGTSRLVAIDAAGPAVAVPVPPPCERLAPPPGTPAPPQACIGPDQRAQMVHPPGTQIARPPGAQIVRPWQGPATFFGPPFVHAIRSGVLGSPRFSSVGWILIIVGAAGLVLLSVLSWFLGRRQRRAVVPAG